MLLRLMGLEQEALNSSYSHPFTDVSGWSEPYIAYAYNKGITKGISQTRFGSNDKATASMYATFVLRALGYTCLLYTSIHECDESLRVFLIYDQTRGNTSNGGLYRYSCIHERKRTSTYAAL